MQLIPNELPTHTFLAGYVGSLAHGTYIPPDEPAGTDDVDLLGVCFARREYYLGFLQFEQFEEKRDKWDIVIYECRKMLNLLLTNNPNVLSLLWLPDDLYVIRTPVGDQLIAHRDLFSSQRAFRSFSGYAFDQLKQMSERHTAGYMGAKRKLLVEQFGYDTKAAAHAIRLLRMGAEFMRTGILHVRREDAEELRAIKRGEWPLARVTDEADRLFNAAEDAFAHTKLPPDAERFAVEQMMMQMIADYLCHTRP